VGEGRWLDERPYAAFGGQSKFISIWSEIVHKLGTLVLLAFMLLYSGKTSVVLKVNMVILW
jgi:hypothetical protein